MPHGTLKQAPSRVYGGRFTIPADAHIRAQGQSKPHGTRLWRCGNNRGANTCVA